MTLGNKIKRRLYKRWGISPLVQNINLNPVGYQRSVLICYVDYTLISKQIENNNLCHSIPKEEMVIIRRFIECDYVIDVCGYDAISVIPMIENKKYDIIFGFGDVYREMSIRNPLSQKILYLTESPAEYSFEKEKERIDYFYLRTGIKIEMVRSGVCFKVGDIELSDIIINMCESSLIEKYNIKNYKICPSGLVNAKFIHKTDKKDIKKFMWFGSMGIIHKGLDILVDTFEKTKDCQLFVCGANEKEIEKYKISLNKNNIRNCGFVNVNSQLFIELVDQCAYMILPSCAEATSTSVITCMRHGMIPVITRNLGFNEFFEFCYFLEDYHIEYMEQKIKELSNNNIEDMKKLSSQIYQRFNKKFSINTFNHEFKSILDEIG
ncbi:MAG TPA: glycosyltransferase [Sedimentibacter sp.]|nr:glycosyltransferase [Sedimentibacter sp.]